jgi:hypothetical protein
MANTITYTENDRVFIINDMKDYISQSHPIEREAYQREFQRIENSDFLGLVNSGIFHDAIGKIVCHRITDYGLEVDVLTDY